MKLAFAGLGKMGANMARRAMQGGHEVVVYDLRDEAVSAMESEGAGGVRSLAELAGALSPAPDKGWGRVGPPGSGHFVKMVHNGIEYGMMQTYAEGFDLLGKKREFDLDLPQIAEIWRHGSVVRSWLLDLTARALEENPQLDGIAPYVTDSGEGRWTVVEAIDLNVAIPVISMALQLRFRSRDAAAVRRSRGETHGFTAPSVA